MYFALHFDDAILRLVPDDAFYYLKIAQNVAHGFGSVFSVGEPTNGYHPLWLVVLTVLHLVTDLRVDGVLGASRAAGTSHRTQPAVRVVEWCVRRAAGSARGGDRRSAPFRQASAGAADAARAGGRVVVLLLRVSILRSGLEHCGAYIAVVVIVLDLVPEHWAPPRSVTMLVVLLPLTGYSLSNGYDYPRMSTSIASTRDYAVTAPKKLRLCSTDSGLLGYFSRHTVVNLDGVVNNRALEAIRAGRFTEYTRAIGCDEVRVDTGRLVFYDRNLPKPCKATFEHGWYAREASVDSWWAWSAGSGSIVVDTDSAGNWLLEAQLASAVVPNDVTYVLNGRPVGRQVVD